MFYIQYLSSQSISLVPHSRLFKPYLVQPYSFVSRTGDRDAVLGSFAFCVFEAIVIDDVGPGLLSLHWWLPVAA